MATYVALINWTEQGIRNVKETLTRAQQAQASAEQMGGRLTALYWTQGAYDLVCTAEFPDEESYTAWALAMASRGSVRTQTLRAFGAAEIERILQKLP